MHRIEQVLLSWSVLPSISTWCFSLWNHTTFLQKMRWQSILGMLNFTSMFSTFTLWLPNTESAQIVCRKIHCVIVLPCTTQSLCVQWMSLVQCCSKFWLWHAFLMAFSDPGTHSYITWRFYLRCALKRSDFVIPICDCMHLIYDIWTCFIVQGSYFYIMCSCSPVNQYVDREACSFC